MQFFLFDFALAFLALLGYRALVAVMRHSVPALSLAGRARSHPQLTPARKPETAPRRRRVEPQPVVPKRPLYEDPPGASPHRLINFW